MLLSGTQSAQSASLIKEQHKVGANNILNVARKKKHKEAVVAESLN